MIGQMYRSFRWGKDIDLIVLDERNHRDPPATAACSSAGRPDPLPAAAAPGAPSVFRAGRALLGLQADAPAGCVDALDDPSRTMLGAEQKAYLEQRLKTSDATWKVIVNEVPMQQLFVSPYDRWEGYAAERREILSYIRDNGIKNVVVLTTDLHGTVFGPLRVDLFTDPEPAAYEAIVGAIAATTLKLELQASFGEAASDAFGPLLLSVGKVDCVDAESFAYGLVEVDPASATLTITSKDAAGKELCKKQLTAKK